MLLTFIGYDGTLAVQSDGTLLGIRLLFSIVPMALYALVALSLVAYFKLDKMMPQIREDNEKRREATRAAEQEQ